MTSGGEGVAHWLKKHRHWPRVRAVLVAGHLLAVVVMSLPTSGDVANPKTFRSANTRAEFRAWAGRLERVGVSTSPQSLEEAAWRFATGYARVHKPISVPFAVYGNVTGARQGWQMFASPQRRPAEVHVDIAVDDKWVPLFRPQSGWNAWRHDQLAHDRLRKFQGRFARSFYARRYRSFAEWLGEMALADHPEATAASVYLVRYRSLSPDEVVAGVPRSGEEGNRVLVSRKLDP